MDQLLVALDVESGERAMQLVTTLRGLAGGFKIGNRLFTTEGPALVRRIVDAGSRVFLDLKYHDIPNTVEQAVDAAVATGVWMINVHASGGTAMMEAAARAARETSTRLGRPAPLMIGVTVLTSTGFGDVTPLSRAARGICMIEQITGALFVAILIARLAGVYPPRESYVDDTKA